MKVRCETTRSLTTSRVGGDRRRRVEDDPVHGAVAARRSADDARGVLIEGVHLTRNIADENRVSGCDRAPSDKTVSGS